MKNDDEKDKALNEEKSNYRAAEVSAAPITSQHDSEMNFQISRAEEPQDNDVSSQGVDF